MSKSIAEQITEPSQPLAGQEAGAVGAADGTTDDASSSRKEEPKDVSGASNSPDSNAQYESDRDASAPKLTKTVSIRAPPPVDKAAKVYGELRIQVDCRPFFSTVHTRPLLPYCARSRIPSSSNIIRWPENTLEYQEARRVSEREQRQAVLREYKYVVVGIIRKDKSTPTERLRRVTRAAGLFVQIRKAEKQLRSPLRRLLSLKHVAGFGLYECHPKYDYHSTPDMSDETHRSLSELFRTYRTDKYDFGDRWMNWVHENFNSSSTDPSEGRYSLQLQLQWSPVKLIVWSITPVLLSLAIGIWYMLASHGDVDHVTVVQTAWTIASYIVTTTALVLAIVAAITQIGDI